MGTGYTRNDSANNIADGNVINASDLDGEFDAVQAAFNGTTGHSHDGTTGEGPQIAAGGLASNAVTTDKIANSNVTLAKMAANSIDSDQYVDGSIDTVHIANDAVTGDKLANNIQIAGTLGVTGETTLTTHLNMGDNDRIKVGDSADLQIYHDGNNKIEASGGYLRLASTTSSTYVDGNNVYIRSGDGGETLARFNDDSDVKLYYNNSQKLATTNTGINVTGNVVVSGNVDGRDVASDGTKLDGIESGATADQTASEILTLIKTVDGSGSGLDADTLDGVTSGSFLRSDAGDTKTSGNLLFNDNIKLEFGTGGDLQIYHNGSHSYIDDTGTGNLILRGNAAISLQKYTGETMGQFTADGAVSLYYNAVVKLATKSDGVDITGELQSDSLDVDGNADISGQLTMGGNVNLQDGDYLQLGSSQDLKIYHSGTNSFIDDTGTGDLYIRASDDLYIQKYTGEIMLHCNVDSSVDIYYDNAVKFQTKSDGVDIIGELQSDSLDVDGAANISGTLTMGGNIDLQDNDKIVVGTGNDLEIFHDGGNSVINETGTGDLIIYTNGTAFQVDSNAGENMIYAAANGAVTLYHNNSAKLNTTSGGININGAISAVDDITLAGSIYHEGDTDSYFGFHAANAWRVVTGSTQMLEVNDNYIQLSANSKASVQTTNVASSISPNMYLFNSFVLTLTGNISLTNPTTEVVGMSGVFVFIHSGAGRTVSLGTQYRTVGGAGLTLSGTAGAVDVVPYFVRATGIVNLGTPQLGFA